MADRNKLKGMVENVLAEVDKHRDEIKVLKDGKSFADFVELKRQIKELKEENVVLSQGLNSDRKVGLQLFLQPIYRDYLKMIPIFKSKSKDMKCEKSSYVN